MLHRIAPRFTTLAAAAALLLATACGGGSTTSAPAEGGTASMPSPIAPAVASAAGTAVAPGMLFPTPDGAAATVGGESISYAEVDAEGEVASFVAAQLVDLKKKVHQRRSQATDKLIDDKLMEAAAKEAGLDIDAWKKREIDDKVTDPSEAEAEEWCNQNPRCRGKFDQENVKQQVMAMLQKSGPQQRQAEVIASLREKAGVEVLIEPLRFDVAVADHDPIKGSKDAPIQIIEFSDYECPYCSRVLPSLEKIKETYGDKVAITFMDYPLPFHKKAPKASEAANCAQEQGKYWEMHDKLFENQRGLEVEKLKGYAEDLGLDMAAFNECLDSGKHGPEIEEDMKVGQAVGVSGTPAFFINGRNLSGAQPFEAFQEVIDEELKKKGLL